MSLAMSEGLAPATAAFRLGCIPDAKGYQGNVRHRGRIDAYPTPCARASLALQDFLRLNFGWYGLEDWHPADLQF